MKDIDLEKMLRQSLASTDEPEEQLNQSIIDQLKERSQMKRNYRKKLSVGLIAAVLLLVLSISAYAASQLFSAKEVAEHLEDQLLADAFESKDAIQINQSVDSGAYNFTLHGLVSGAGISEFRHSAEDIFPDRTYAVVSIIRQDGKPMPSTTDLEYGQEEFFISPLIKGLEPWTVNIASMNGAYSEFVIDGVMYRMIECDQVEVFADRGVYLAISSGSTFFRQEAFMYNEETGEIQAREDYTGAAVLFNLPLKVDNADEEKAEAYLEALLTLSSAKNSSEEEEEWVHWYMDLRAKVRNGESIGETIADSIKEVSYDDAGNAVYSYKDRKVTKSVEQLFDEGQTGFSDTFPISGDKNSYKVPLFHRDENGVITGRIVILKKELEL